MQLRDEWTVLLTPPQLLHSELNELLALMVLGDVSALHECYGCTLGPALLGHLLQPLLAPRSEDQGGSAPCVLEGHALGVPRAASGQGQRT